MPRRGHLLCALLLPRVTPLSYFISPSGNDAASGSSPASAWASCAPLSAHTLSPSDALLFEGVDHHLVDGCTLTSPSVGTRIAPIVVATYGGGRARLFVDGSRANGLTILDTSGVAVYNLSIAHDGTAPATKSGVAVIATSTTATMRFSNGILVSNVDVSGFALGIALGATGCAGFEHVLIEACSVTGCLATGILSYGAFVPGCYSHANVTVAHCNASNNPGRRDDVQGWSGSGIVLSGVDGGLITASLAAHNGRENGHHGGGPVGIWAYDANNITISHCVAHDNANGFADGSSNDGGGFDLDGGTTNSRIEYSLSFNNAGPGFLVCQFDANVDATANNTLSFSVSYHDGLACSNGASGLNFYTPDATLRDTDVVGCTFISNTSAPVVAPLNSATHDFTGTVLARNALLSLGDGSNLLLIDFDVSSGLKLEGNAYWSSPSPQRYRVNHTVYATLKEVGAATGLEVGAGGQPTGTDADPHLMFGTDFFRSCVPWWSDNMMPDLPNSPALDAVRGFAGCPSSAHQVSSGLQ